jgi:ATP-dependent DNA ligase
VARSIEKVPSGERRIHGIKFDGYRVQVHLANEAAKIFTLRGHDWTYRFTTDLAELHQAVMELALEDRRTAPP